MKARELKSTLNALIDARLPTFIWGAPGIGKSSIVKQVADERGFEFIDLRLSLLDPTDLKGIPFFDKDEGEAVWAKPNFLPKEGDLEGILFLDEINSAPPSVQASAYQLVLDRKVGDYELPKGWRIVAAGNRESDRGVVYRMPPPLANRFVHLEMEVSFEDWKLWAYESGIGKEVIGFLEYKSEYLLNFDPTKNERSFPTPRSWEYVDRIIHSKIESSQLHESIEGTIGKDTATQFVTFMKVKDRLPDIDDILEGKSVELDEDSRVIFMTISSIISHLLKKDDEQSISNVLKFSYSLPSEFAIMLVQDMQKNGIPIEQNSEWDRWVEKFSHLLS